MYQEIRERICLLRYRPGTRLREVELAKEFGVSRTPVRQVLQRLQYEGLVDMRNGVGTIVTGVDFKSFRDVYEVRLKIAELIGFMSPLSCSQADIALMDGLLARAQRLRETGDVEEFWRINHERHQAIGRLIGNEALRRIYDLFYYQTARVWYHLVSEMWDEEIDVLCAELKEVLRAMHAGDMQAVGFVTRNYISMGMNRIGRCLRAQPTPPSPPR